jgi:hypothetical protein
MGSVITEASWVLLCLWGKWERFVMPFCGCNVPIIDPTLV